MRLRKTITTIVATAILLAGWQLFAVIANQPELIPSLPRLVRTLCEWLVSGSFYQSVGATILRGVLGMSISFVCAIGMAGLFARFEWVYELFRPLLAIMRSIPVISFILLALIFLNPETPALLLFLYGTDSEAPRQASSYHPASSSTAPLFSAALPLPPH